MWRRPGSVQTISVVNNQYPSGFSGDPNYPAPNSGNYQTASQGLNGVNYSSAGTPYAPALVTTVPGTPAAGLIRNKYRDKTGGYSWNGTTSPGVNVPSNWDMNFPAGYPFVKSTVDAYVSWGFQIDTPENENFCMEWKGYFQAPATANFNMFITSDDDSVVWVGNNAYNGNYTNSNYAVKTSNALTRNTNTMQLSIAKWYPIRIWYAEYQGGCNFQMYFQQDDGTKYNGHDITWAYNTVTGGY